MDRNKLHTHKTSSENTNKFKRASKWLALLMLENTVAPLILAVLALLGQRALQFFNIISAPFWSYLDTYPFRVLLAAFVLGALSTICIKIIRKYWVLSVDHQLMERLVSNFGIESFWNDLNGCDQQQAWQYCQDSISNNPSDLRIMGASGWGTFGNPQSPLHNTVKTYPGSMYFLLMHPENPHLPERAQSLGVSADSYIEEINNSIHFLKSLKQSGNRDIELQLYHQPPIWKMVITGGFMWLQHYKQGHHVHEMPVYGFASAESTSLYHPLLEVFLKRWKRDGDQTVQVNLNEWQRAS